MEESKKTELLKGVFSGATFTNSVVAGVVEKGATLCYNMEEKASGKPKRQPCTDGQIAKALLAITGKENTLNNFQLWLGGLLPADGEV